MKISWFSSWEWTWKSLSFFCSILSRRRASQVLLVVKNRPTNPGDLKRCRFDARVGKIPWRRAGQPTPVFLPEESHGQRCLAGQSMGLQRVGRDWSDLTHTSRKNIEDKEKTGSLLEAWPFWGLVTSCVPSSFSSGWRTWCWRCLCLPPTNAVYVHRDASWLSLEFPTLGTWRRRGSGGTI